MLLYAYVWSAYSTCRSCVVAIQRAIVQVRGVGGSAQKMMFGFGACCLLVGVHVATCIVVHVKPTKIWKLIFRFNSTRPITIPGRYRGEMGAMMVVLLVAWAEKHSHSNRKQQRVPVWISVHDEQNFDFMFVLLCASGVLRILCSFSFVGVVANYITNPHLH